MTRDFQHYKINIRKGNDASVKWVYSNLFQKDIVSRLFTDHEVISNGEYIHPNCLRFTALPQELKGVGSVVFVTTLYPEEVIKLKTEVKRWKRIYKI